MKTGCSDDVQLEQGHQICVDLRGGKSYDEVVAELAPNEPGW
jgi:hypothetical protein